MTDGIEFLKNEVARLKAEQAIENDPLTRLELEKQVRKVSAIIRGVEEKAEKGEPSYQNSDANKNEVMSERESLEKYKSELARSEQSRPVENKKISLTKISEGIIAGVLVLVVAWVVAHYFGIEL